MINTSQTPNFKTLYNSAIDVIIPVYNNINLTLCALASVYRELAPYLNKVIIHDDCSDAQTSHTLANLCSLNHPNLLVLRSEPNIGFAAGVNKASLYATADYLFILNSDTEILADILRPMLTIIENTPEIAAINPSGPVFKSKRLKRCQSYSILNQGEKFTYIESTNISGYAMLIRNSIFKKVGGFNTLYGRGYYEDNELTRVLLNQGYKLAIYQTNKISHVGQSSFKLLKASDKKINNFAKELIAKNKSLYLERYPDARANLKVYSLNSDFTKFSNNTQNKIINIVKAGGTVTIYSLFEPKHLPYFQVKFKRISLAEVINNWAKLKKSQAIISE